MKKFLYEENIEAYFKSIQDLSLLSKEEEEALIQKVKEGDKNALDKIVLANLRFIISIAKKYKNYDIPFSDLISAGNLGLVEAAKRFDPSKGVKFTTYASWWIRQSIADVIWHESEIIKKPNRMHVNAYKINNAYSYLKELFGREPSIDEIVEFLKEQGVKIKKRMVEKHFLFKGLFLSLDAPVNTIEDDVLTLEGVISIFDTKDIEKDIHEEDLKRIIKSLLDGLSQREREVIIFRFGLNDDDPKTLSDVGKILGISKERVRQIEKRALKKLRSMIGNKYDFF
jgi:RNA polymerase primary sigma factor